MEGEGKNMVGGGWMDDLVVRTGSADWWREDRPVEAAPASSNRHEIYWGPGPEAGSLGGLGYGQRLDARPCASYLLTTQ